MVGLICIVVFILVWIWIFYQLYKAPLIEDDENLIDRGIGDDYNVGLFEKEALSAIDVIFETKDKCILTGGSGLYIDAVCKGIDEMPKISAQPRKEKPSASKEGSRISSVLADLDSESDPILDALFRDDAKSEGEPQAWSVGDAIATIPTQPQQQECTHGMMILKEGTAKTGKPYYGYVCSAPKPEQCDARWGKLTANGNWYFEGGE